VRLFLQYDCEKLKAVMSESRQDSDTTSSGSGSDAAAAGPGVLGLLTQPLTAELVLGVLRTVIDPELGVNIVDLGLIYDVVVEPPGAVAITMTLTTPGCPLGGFLDDQVRANLAQLPQVRAVQLSLVFSPPWEPELMSDAARDALGWG
jgi:metal-sulfur cluster biosynthetic enzyme